MTPAELAYRRGARMAVRVAVAYCDRAALLCACDRRDPTAVLGSKTGNAIVAAVDRRLRAREASRAIHE